MEAKSLRICSGEYIITDGKNEATISYMDHLKGWIVSATWDHYRYSDPIKTKREALICAKEMLRTANDF